MTTSA
jgi:hypothetical protein